MAGSYRKPLDNNLPIPFTIDVDGQPVSGTITPSGKPVSFGMPNAFIVRMAGKPPANISIYMGKWIMHAPDTLVKSLSVWIETHYKS